MPLLPLVWALNIALLPLVAIYPGFADGLRTVVDRFGVWGVDPRDSPRRPEGKLGYSPTLHLWWRSLVLFDVCASLRFLDPSMLAVPECYSGER